MIFQRYYKTHVLPMGLITLMVLTRFHHFGDALHLPDASLAVFFFAGFYRNNAFIAFLMALSGLIDYVAIANGTSGWCVSPAYVFLIPTYTVLWLAGRYCAILAKTELSQQAYSVRTFGLLMLATTIAFGLSNGSFYLFSDHFYDLTLFEYYSRVAHYYPSYLGYTLLYVIVGYGVDKLIKMIISLQGNHDTAS